MSLVLKRGRDGSWRPHWYADVLVDGKRKVFNLGVRVKGKTPERVSEVGDGPFENSRKRAKDKLDVWLEKTHSKGHAEELIERLIESKTGAAVEHVAVADLCECWLGLPRAAGELSQGYTTACRAGFGRFATFMASHNRKATLLYQVRSSDVAAFMKDLRATVAPRTASMYLQLLRSAFSRFLPGGVVNPFVGTITRKRADAATGGESVHRLPFTPAELSRVFAVAREYQGGMLHGPIVAAACTAMRRGDVCHLRWADITGDMIATKTSKTGERVEIPIFPPLRGVLTERHGNGSEFVFPEAAQMLDGVPNPDYRKGAGPEKRWAEKPNPHGLTWRFKNIVARALSDVPTSPESTPFPAEDVREAGETAIAGLSAGLRRDHMRDVFARYCDGQSVRQIAAATGYGKGSVSEWLAAVEDLIGKRFVRSGQAPNIRPAIAKLTRAKRKDGQGKLSASVRDWHALRTTFVTLALSAGVSLEIVKRITGHRTAEIVMTHYFRPDREQFKDALAVALPGVLTGGKIELTPAEELHQLTGKMAAGTATASDRKRARFLLPRA